MENLGEIPKLVGTGLTPDESAKAGYSSSPPTEMAINCEWGAFDSFAHEHLPRTKYDKIVDESSNKPGEQAFEVWPPFTVDDPSVLTALQKLISGAYLGEILRLVIVDLIDKGQIFIGQKTYKLENPYSFDTALVSLLESDDTEQLLMIVGVFTHFFGIETTLAERQFFRALARMVGRRAARLSACGIAAIVSKCGMLDEGCKVGADGSLYNVRLFSSIANGKTG
jgi:hexokinase